MDANGEIVVSTEQWLQDELVFINEKMAATLIGRLKAELLSCDDATQELTLRYPLQDWQVNGLGTLHGGMINTMMDLTMSMVVYCFSRETIPPTVSMTANYLRPVPMEDYVLIRARVTSLGRRNATAYCEAIVPKTGKVACTSIGTYAIIPKKA
ncbi:MAG: PaaI family thioesterase [Oscillospiraceae bacterium]|nr:PaaI family thioesterase [Oscillospiraceae bacterium]